MQKHVCSIYIFLWCLYGLQGTLYARGGTISGFILLLLIVMSLYYLYKLVTNYKIPDVLKVLVWLLVLWTAYGFAIIVDGNGVVGVSDTTYLKNIYISQLPIFAFYYFSKRGYLTESILKKWTIAFLILGIVIFNTHYNENLARAVERGSDKEEFTNNKAYVILAIIPLIPLFYKKIVVQYILLGVCMFYVLMGMKRGAILSGAVCSVWFLFKSFKGVKYNREINNRKIIWRSILTVAVVWGVVYAVQRMMLTSDYFIYRLEATSEGDSSGRDEIFTNYYKFFFSQSSIIHLLFGNGADATVRLLGQYAHNDWLELAINNGLVAVVLYLIYWIVMLKTIIKTRKINTTYQLMLSMFFIVYLMKTFYSMTYYSTPFSSTCAFAFALANCTINEKK